MAYADHTFKDKNPVKSWLQQQRLVTALNLAKGREKPVKRMLDFGAGDGELCKQFAHKYDKSTLFCYEPTPALLDEARKNLAVLNSDKNSFLAELSADLNGSMDVVYCLEVFEHLPPKETFQAIRSIQDLLHANGIAIIGVPVEVGIPALYKGLFRLTRRYGQFDATVKNILLATMFRPPRERPVGEIAPGLHFHFEHLGFDWRTLRELLQAEFKLLHIVSSPLKLGAWCMPEVYFVVRKK
jgi:SAM-dependent methyltransferase